MLDELRRRMDRLWQDYDGEDPERMARFANWAEKSLEADDAPKPLDASTL